MTSHVSRSTGAAGHESPQADAAPTLAASGWLEATWPLLLLFDAAEITLDAAEEPPFPLEASVVARFGSSSMEDMEEQDDEPGESLPDLEPGEELRLASSWALACACLLRRLHRGSSMLLPADVWHPPLALQNALPEPQESTWESFLGVLSFDAADFLALASAAMGVGGGGGFFAASLASASRWVYSTRARISHRTWGEVSSTSIARNSRLTRWIGSSASRTRRAVGISHEWASSPMKSLRSETTLRTARVPANMYASTSSRFTRVGRPVKPEPECAAWVLLVPLLCCWLPLAVAAWVLVLLLVAAAVAAAVVVPLLLPLLLPLLAWSAAAVGAVPSRAAATPPASRDARLVTELTLESDAQLA